MDRNAGVLFLIDEIQLELSLSARRAWIEMLASGVCLTAVAVALRKESVDRNAGTLAVDGGVAVSLSARRAWIEMHNVIFG